jgi:hypothetical protein
MTSRANNFNDFNLHNLFSRLQSPRVVSAAGGDGEAHPRLAKADRDPLPILANAAREMAGRVRAGEVSFTDAVEFCHSAALEAGLPDDSASIRTRSSLRNRARQVVVGNGREGRMIDLRSLALALGGDVCGKSVSAPGPGHSPRDRSLSVALDSNAPDGFLIYSHAGDDWKVCRDYVRQRLGLPSWQPGDEQNRTIPPKHVQKWDLATIESEVGLQPRTEDDLIRIERATNRAAQLQKNI